MKTKSIKQTVNFNTTPDKLYALLLDSKKLTAIHGQKTSMTKRSNGKFTVFGGYCHGYNIDLKEGKKIVQAWHFAEEGWPEEHFSTCTFLLAPSAKGTKLTFTQTDVPAPNYESLSDGWKTYYWQPIAEYLEK